MGPCSSSLFKSSGDRRNVLVDQSAALALFCLVLSVSRHQRFNMSRVWQVCVILLLGLASAAATTVLSLPADQIVKDGSAATAICSSCCQQGSYCGTTSTDVVLQQGSLLVSVPKKLQMTCLLRDRTVQGAVDGGLCVPDVAAIKDSDIQDFCLDYLKVT